MESLKVWWVHCKTRGPSELHMQGDLPEFLVLGLVFLLGQARGKPTRRKLSLAFFSPEEEWYWIRQRPAEA